MILRKLVNFLEPHLNPSEKFCVEIDVAKLCRKKAAPLFVTGRLQKKSEMAGSEFQNFSHLAVVAVNV